MQQRAILLVFLLGIKGELEVLSWGSVCVFLEPHMRGGLGGREESAK